VLSDRILTDEELASVLAIAQRLRDLADNEKASISLTDRASHMRLHVIKTLLTATCCIEHDQEDPAMHMVAPLRNKIRDIMTHIRTYGRNTG
jgi:hypothetical protein